MFKPLELFIGLRYTRAKRRNHFVSFISLTSMLGIALGVTALITVLSVMNGFEKELRDRILGMVSHATIYGLDGPITDWSRIVKKAEGEPHVKGAAPFIQGEVMLTHDGRVSGSLLYGVDPTEEGRVSDVVKDMKVGRITDLKPGDFGIILGKDLAQMLGVDVGDKVTVITPEASVTVAGVLPRLRRFTVVGIFEVGMYEYDRSIALTDLGDAARLLRMGNGITGVRLKFDNLMRAPILSRRVANSLPGAYRVVDWTQQNSNFFKAVQTEKTTMFVILTLIVAVAAFNIISTLIMVVTDKQADIAILRTLGAAPGTIMRIFMVQGSFIGVIGTLLGVIGGVALSLNVETIVPFIERVFHVQFMPADVYYISNLPSQLDPTDVVRITVVALILSFLATLYPAWRAARTAPAEALRYE